MSKHAAFNVDVDSLYLYYRLHDLDEAQATNVVWERGVRRFAELFAEFGIRATFFVVGEDLERWPSARRVAQELVAEGHELGNHSWSHPYDLTRQPSEVIAKEIARAGALISELRGQPVSGFRAPGYNMTNAVFEELREQGYRYSSSIFPCPPYYLAKAAVMASMRLRRKRSAAILGHPRVMWAPRGPHRRQGLKEIPVTVLPGLRLPFIGTSLLMMGSRGYRMMRPLLRRTSLINLEFHGIDMCDLALDDIAPELLKQPDLRHPLQVKRALFREVLSDLCNERKVCTLEELATDSDLMP